MSPDMGVPEPKDFVPISVSDLTAIESEAGILDIQESAETALELASKAIGHINELIIELGEHTDARVAEIGESSFVASPARDKKNFINEFASFIEKCATNLSHEARTARENFSLYSDRMIALLELRRQGTSDEEHRTEVTAFLQMLEGVLPSIPQSKSGVDGFKAAVISMPRITMQFNQSKRALIAALDECSEFFDQTEKSIYEMIATISEHTKSP